MLLTGLACIPTECVAHVDRPAGAVGVLTPPSTAPSNGTDLRCRACGFQKSPRQAFPEISKWQPEQVHVSTSNTRGGRARIWRFRPKDADWLRDPSRLCAQESCRTL